MSKLYLSYCSRDIQEAERIKNFLQADGHQVELPTHGKKQEQGGDETLNKALEKAVADADRVLFLLTPFWQASRLAALERQWAEAADRPSVAAMLSPVAKPGLAEATPLVDLTLNRKAGEAELLETLATLATARAEPSAPRSPPKPEPHAEPEQPAAHEAAPRKDEPAVGPPEKKSPLDDISFPPRTAFDNARAERAAKDDEQSAVVPVRRHDLAPARPQAARATTFEREIDEKVDAARENLKTAGLSDWLNWALQRPVTANPGKARTRTGPPPTIEAEALEPETQAEANARAGGTGDMPPAQFNIAAQAQKAFSFLRADKKRMMAAGGGALAFLLALVWMMFGGSSEEDRMRAELRNFKSRQALLLSKVSNHLLQNGDRETAMLMALEAVAHKAGSEADKLQARTSLYTAWLRSQEGLVMRGHGNHVSSVAFSPDGLFVLSASWDETVRLWEIKSGRQALALQAHDSLINDAAISPDQKQIVTAAIDGKARLFDSGTGKLLHTFEGHADDLNSVAFSPDGKQFVTASADQTAQLWDLASRKPVHSFIGHKGAIESVVFSPDGSRVVTASADKTARIFNARTGSLITTLAGHEGTVRDVAYAPNGGYIATVSEDRTVRLWNAYTGNETRRFTGHKWAVLGVGFSADGKYLATGSKDNTARLWEVSSGKPLMVLKGHSGIVTDATFSPDGGRMATSSGDGSVRLWPVIIAEKPLVEQARAAVLSCLSRAGREKYFLSPEPPGWCVEMKKRPYNSEDWRSWLKEKKAGRDARMPE